jgi:hypothetical protein
VSWRGCYDSLTEVLETLASVSSMTHVKPCHVIAEIYRCHWKKPHKRDTYIRTIIGENPPQQGHALLVTKYAHPEQPLEHNVVSYNIKGWKQVTQYNAELIVRVLAARFRIKCKQCNRLHDDQRNKHKYKAYIDGLEWPLCSYYLPAPICLDCAKRLPYDNPDYEKVSLIKMFELLRVIGKSQNKGTLTKKRLDSIVKEIEHFA